MRHNSRIFKIAVPKPCSENWELMDQKEHGRFCQNCKKVVFDFSNLTKEELYFHFSALKEIPCGRFSATQLDTNLLSEKPKPYWKSLFKPLAAFVAFLLLKGSEAATVERVNTIVRSSDNKTTLPGFQDTVTISGLAKDAFGNGIENAEISFNQKLVTKTDKDGKFKFEFEIEDHSKFYLVQISYPGMITEVRNYHSAMRSTSFSVILEKPDTSHYFGYTMGISIVSTDDFPLLRISFTKGTGQLTRDSKKELAILAGKMRINPEVSITITSYAASPNEAALSKKRQNAIKDYLIEEEGISSDRFKIKMEPNTCQMQNTIEISLADWEK